MASLAIDPFSRAERGTHALSGRIFPGKFVFSRFLRRGHKSTPVLSFYSRGDESSAHVILSEDVAY